MFVRESVPTLPYFVHVSLIKRSFTGLFVMNLKTSRQR